MHSFPPPQARGKVPSSRHLDTGRFQAEALDHLGSNWGPRDKTALSDISGPCIASPEKRKTVYWGLCCGPMFMETTKKGICKDCIDYVECWDCRGF